MKRRAWPRRLLLVILALLLVAAGALSLSTPTDAAGLSWPALRNATYPTSLAIRTVTLRDGEFEAEAAPGSAAKVTVRLVDLGAFGNLDRGDRPDAAVVIVTSGGGTGLFVDLVAVLNDNGTARPTARVLLGDRVLVREVRIEDNQIVVRMRTRGAADPLTRLTQEIVRRYALQTDGLVLLHESTSDVPLAVPEDYVYRPARLELAPGAGRIVDGSLPPGQIASYVIHGRAGETLDLHARSLFNNAVLSVSGLGDGLTLVSRRDYTVDKTLVLSTEQDYVVRVVSLAGSTLPFTLNARLDVPQRTPEPTARPTGNPFPSARPTAAPPRPGSMTERPLVQLSDSATKFTVSRPPIVGVAVVVPSAGAIYAQNADEQVPTASVVKVMVMLVVLDQARLEKRPVSEAELALLWPMITESDNDATSELWDSVGRGQAVGSYLQAIGVTGFTPDPGKSWGVSFASARAMATALGKLLSGEILDEPSRALALRLLDSVIPEQRWGVSAGTEVASGDAVGIKDGWYPGDEGWRVNSVGLVRPKGGSAYAIAVMTGARPSLSEGVETIEGIAEKINAEMRHRQAD